MLECKNSEKPTMDPVCGVCSPRVLIGDLSILLATIFVAGIVGGLLGVYIADSLPNYGPEGYHDFGYGIREKFGLMLGCLLGPLTVLFVPTRRPRPVLRLLLLVCGVLAFLFGWLPIIQFFHLLLGNGPQNCSVS
jgi:hypothetical protein